MHETSVSLLVISRTYCVLSVKTYCTPTVKTQCYLRLLIVLAHPCSAHCILLPTNSPRHHLICSKRAMKGDGCCASPVCCGQPRGRHPCRLSPAPHTASPLHTPHSPCRHMFCAQAMKETGAVHRLSAVANGEAGSPAGPPPPAGMVPSGGGTAMPPPPPCESKLCVCTVCTGLLRPFTALQRSPRAHPRRA